jgi:mono/diheme cytochrome c family protein/uncharacterized membrane protein
MRFNCISTRCVIGLLFINPAVIFASSDQNDLGTAVKAVFKAKCAECHGPEAQPLKGSFGYVLDLKKLAADRKKVMPFMPEKSGLWQLIQDGEMPAEGAKAGPLTKAQKEVVRAWIEAGAPSATVEPEEPNSNQKAAPSPSASPEKRRFVDWVGNFHVVLVHFPIGLLLAAVAGECWFAWWRVRTPSPAVRFCISLGAGTAVVTALIGWVHAASGYGASSPHILLWHRWLGTATAVAAVIIAIFSEIDSRRGMRSRWFRVLLLLVGVMVGAAAHLGGLLVYGADYFAW